MHLLVITEYFPASENDVITGGVEARAFYMFKTLAQTYRITIICSKQDRGQLKHQRIAGIDVHRVGPVHPYANDGHVHTRLAFAFAALIACLRIRAFDAVEGYSYLAYPIAAAISRLRRRPGFATIHELWTVDEWKALKGPVTGRLGAAWVALGLRIGFDRYIAVSDATRRSLLCSGVDDKRIDVVPNGIDKSIFNAIEGFPDARPSVSASMRLVSSKRADLLVEAAAILKPRFPDLVVTIQGEGSERDALDRLIRDKNLDTMVRIIGRVSLFEDALAIRKRHQVFCLPSVKEGFGMVALEAMALGVPVVVSDIPVLRETTGDGCGAVYFQPGNAEALAAELSALFADEELRTSLGQAARAHASRYHWTNLVDRLQITYEKGLVR